MIDVHDKAPCSPRDYLLLACISLGVCMLHWSQLAHSIFFTVPQLDERFYTGFAQAIVMGEDLNRFGGFRPMLYPLFIALGFVVDSSGVLILFVQHLLLVGIALMVAYTSNAIWGSRLSGWLGGLCWILAGPPLFFAGQYLIVTLLTFLVMAVFFCLTVAQQARGKTLGTVYFALAGLCAGLAVQARPTAFLFLLIFAVWGALEWFQDKERKGTGYLIAAMTMTLVLLGFGFVNQLQSGQFQLLTGAGGINFYTGNRIGADGYTPTQSRSVTYAGPYRDSLQVYSEQEFEAETGRSVDDAGPDAVSTFWFKKGMDEISEQPRQWLGLMGKKVLLLLWNYEIPNNKSFHFFAHHETPLFRWLPVRWWLLLALGLPAWVGGTMVRKRFPLLLIPAFCLLYGGGLLLFFINSRFRIPLWPLFCVGTAAWPVLIRQMNRKQITGMILGALVLSAISLPNWAKVQPETPSRDYYFKSKALMAKGRFQEAVDTGRNAANLAPRNPDIQFQYGNSLFAAGLLDEAIDQYLRVAVLDPNEARVWNNLGVAYEYSGMWSQALKAYSRSLACDPSRRSTLGIRLTLYLRTQLFQLALKDL